MALQGSIDSFALADVLRLLASSSKTGRLVLNGDRGAGNMWLVDGELVGGNTAAVGSPSGPGDPAEVLFDMMRFTEGSFIFEADAPCPEPRGGVPVEPIIRQAEDALDEWRSVTEVVPGLDAWMELSAEIAREITLDQRTWSVVVAIGDGATADTVAERLQLAELPVLRVLRDLVSLGLAVVGQAPAAAPTVTPPVPDAAVPAAVPAASPSPDETGPTATIEESTDETGPTATIEESTDEPEDRPVLDEPAFAEVFNTPASDPATPPPAMPTMSDPTSPGSAPSASTADDDARAVDPLSSIMASSDDGENDDLDDLFGAFDPFGESDAPAADDDLFAPVETPSPFASETTADAVAAEESAPASDDDLQRQMSMLSPKAAQAVASAAPESNEGAGEQDGEDIDRDRAEVIKFLGSV